jgi:hypothetical protein
MWHNERVIGIVAAVAVIKKLLLDLPPFGCVKVTVKNSTLMVIEKPWEGVIYIVRTLQIHEHADKLNKLSDDLSLVRFAVSPMQGGFAAVTFSSPTKETDAADNCRQFLEIMGNDSDELLVQGLEISVNDMKYPPIVRE